MPSELINELFAKARASHLRGETETAIKHVRAVLQIHPDNAEAHNNLGLLLFESGSFERAVDCYKKSIELDPGCAEVYCNYANALLSIGALSDAAGHFEKALLLKKDLYDALLGSAIVKKAEGNLAAAKRLFCDYLQIRPEDGIAHYHLGTIMREWNMLDLAAICFKNALRFLPGHERALMGLGEALQSAGELDESEKLFSDLIERCPSNHLAYGNLFLSMNYNPAYSPEEIFKAHIRWGALEEAKQSPSIQFNNDRNPDRKLRIGYVSSDFCRHPAASFLEPVIKNHDHDNYTVICYSQGRNRDEKTADFKRWAHEWHEIDACSDDEVTRIIEQDAIDLLVDCTGHMADNRLPVFARRSAPIQIAWIGYPNTTGLRSIDYRFTDEIVDPSDETGLYTEKLVRFANGFCVWAPPGNAPRVTELPAVQNGYITFGSLHTPARLNRKVIALWSRVLAAVADSRLVIFRNTLNDEIVKRISSWFSADGIDPHRVVFLRDVPPAGHLAVYQGVDMALDTFPWSGHTTACEALWMGVPVVTLRGDRSAGRLVASILTHSGMETWIAENEEQYIDKACRFSRDIGSLAEIRKNLRDTVQSSKLCDGIAGTREVEKAMREMWVRWCGKH